MIIDCFGGSSQLYDLEERGFFYDFAVLMIAAVPAAIVSLLWRIFVSNRISLVGTTILGLDENSAMYSEMYDHGISWRTMFLYGVTSVVFGFETFQYLVDLL
jgi:hypothetical protein